MRHVYRTILMGLLIFYLGCESFEFSPNQVSRKNLPRNLNAKSLEKLHATEGDDTVTIAFVGDSQRFYNELDAFIEKVNSLPAVDLVLLAGDITDFGLLEEYVQIEKLLSGLNKPYIGVVGNHDVLANGETIFNEVFGPLDFTFTYQGIKFIVHNTNSREFPDKTVPDVKWLGEQLAKDEPGVNHYIAVSHVPPFDADFDTELESSYTGLWSREPRMLVSLHGHVHRHKDEYPYNDGIRYITSYSFDKRNFVLLKIHKGEIIKSIIPY